MATKYFAWKHPVTDGSEPEWVELTGKQFYKITSSEEGKNRYFKKINDGADDGMDVYVFETTRDDYLAWDRAHKCVERKKKTQKKYKPVFVSMDAYIGPEKEYTYHDIVADEVESIEDRVELEFFIEELRLILKTLSEDELKLVNMLYLDNDRGLSEREIARLNGIDPGTLRYQRTKILKKIKKSFTQK